MRPRYLPSVFWRLVGNQCVSLTQTSMGQAAIRVGCLMVNGHALQEERYGPGCATIDDISILAGGRNQLGEQLKSVEIIFVNTKTSGKAKDMLEPRDHFNLVVLGSTLLAFGGYNQTSMEMWEGIGRPWTEAPMSLANSRSQFSALTFTDSLCSAGTLPPHSCPTLDGGTCVFPFTNGA